MFAVLGTEMGIFIQTEILIQKNILNFRWNTIDFSVACCFSNKLLKCNQDRVGTSL